MISFQEPSTFLRARLQGNNAVGALPAGAT